MQISLLSLLQKRQKLCYLVETLHVIKVTRHCIKLTSTTHTHFFSTAAPDIYYGTDNIYYEIVCILYMPSVANSYQDNQARLAKIFCRRRNNLLFYHNYTNFWAISESKSVKSLAFNSFGLFWKNPSPISIRPLICPTAHFFTLPLLSYVAEYSASWQH